MLASFSAASSKLLEEEPQNQADAFKAKYQPHAGTMRFRRMLLSNGYK